MLKEKKKQAHTHTPAADGKFSGKAFTKRKEKEKGRMEENRNSHTTTMQQIGSVQ